MILPPALAIVTEALQMLIRDSVPETTDVSAHALPDAASSPHESRVNVFLHRISPSTTFRPSDRVRAPAGESPPLELRYLVTAYGNPSRAMGTGELDLLWFAMNAINANPRLPVPALGRDKTVDIVAEDPGAESLAALWQAAQAEFRPSLSYLVRLPPLAPMIPRPYVSAADVREVRLERLGNPRG